MKTSLGKNYDTPKSLVRGLLNVIARATAPKHQCFCRQCRLLRKAAKVVGGFDFPLEAEVNGQDNRDSGEQASNFIR